MDRTFRNRPEYNYIAQDAAVGCGDGVCDDGSLGGTQYCDEGTDSADCDTSDTCCAAHCCSGTSNSCAFQASYGDESGVAGKLVRDMVAIGTGMGRLGVKSYVGVFDKVSIHCVNSFVFGRD